MNTKRSIPHAHVQLSQYSSRTGNFAPPSGLADEEVRKFSFGSKESLEKEEESGYSSHELQDELHGRLSLRNSR